MESRGPVATSVATFDVAARARQGLAGQQGLSGLGDSWLDQLFSHVVSTARTDAETWVLNQYATLRALPARYASQAAQLRTLAATIGTPSGATTDVAGKVLQASQQVGALAQNYPTMMHQVEAAYGAVSAGTVSLASAGIVLSAVVEAQDALQQAQGVDDTIQMARQQLVTMGLLSPTASLGGGPSVSWAWWLGGGLLAFIVLKKVL